MEVREDQFKMTFMHEIQLTRSSWISKDKTRYNIRLQYSV